MSGPLDRLCINTVRFLSVDGAIDNPLKFAGYGQDCWGITASDGPGSDTIKVKGIERQFFDYLRRCVIDYHGT